MNKVWLIGTNTFKEIIRDRILYGLLVFAVFFISLSGALGQLSYTEQGRISLSFGLAGIQISALLLAIFVGSTLVSRELEKRTIFTLLTHAVSRPQFIYGKFLGMVFVLLVVLSCLFGVVFLATHLFELGFNSSILIALYGILLEAMILLGVTMFFGVFTTPTLSVTFTIGVFLVGHWLGDLLYFATKSESATFVQLATFVSYIFPDFERFNWRDQGAYAELIPMSDVVSASAYGFTWIGLYLIASTLIFRRRDFV